MADKEIWEHQNNDNGGQRKQTSNKPWKTMIIYPKKEVSCCIWWVDWRSHWLFDIIGQGSRDWRTGWTKYELQLLLLGLCPKCLQTVPFPWWLEYFSSWVTVPFTLFWRDRKKCKIALINGILLGIFSWWCKTCY